MISIEAIRKRHIEKSEAIRADALEKAKRIAEMLKTMYGARRVILFGSLCRTGYLHMRSDIDLLVEGLSHNNLFHAGFDGGMLGRPFDVDIIPMESAEISVLEVAKREGVEL